MNLILAEMSRLLSRRFAQLMILLLIVTFILTVLVVLGKSKQPTEDMWIVARSAAASAAREQQQDYNACLNNPTRPTASCESLKPRAVPEEYLYGVFTFAHEIKNLIYFLTAFLALFGFLVAASSIGSELHSGSVVNLLLWRPNRTAVLGAKLGVALGFVAVVSVVFTLVYIGTFYGLAAWVGWVGHTEDRGFWIDLILVCMRGITLALVLSAIGFAIATIGRHTAAALGSLIGYIIVWELGARLIVETLNVDNSNTSRDQWFLASHVIAWMSGRDGYSLTTFADATMTLAVIVAALTALAFISFRRRDIT
ncbi:MAG TPA: ABC transporter permease subunit [Candidatus Limnocylindrales bacterium]|nr:ABC transporter permease subunit [Candidatus Limnocylindrales bacterium]